MGARLETNTNKQCIYTKYRFTEVTFKFTFSILVFLVYFYRMEMMLFIR